MSPMFPHVVLSKLFAIVMGYTFQSIFDTPLPAVPNELQQRQWSPTPSQEVEQRVRTQLFSEEDGAEEEQLISIDSILEQ